MGESRHRARLMHPRSRAISRLADIGDAEISDTDGYSVSDCG